MSVTRLDVLSVEELVDLFAAKALDQDSALLSENINRVNLLFDELELIEGELKRRGGDQRRALVRLYEHANPQVRLKAAESTLATAPEIARGKLAEIAESGEYPQAGQARFAIRMLEEGRYTPR